jgi:hypothetical protein
LILWSILGHQRGFFDRKVLELQYDVKKVGAGAFLSIPREL